jgi:hypothetical protein
MQATVKIAQSNTQGKPAVPLPHRAAPTKVTPLRDLIFDGETMTDTVSFVRGMETYAEKHSVRWSEGGAFAAESSYHTYGGTTAPKISVPGITLYAGDYGSVLSGAARLTQVVDFLTFCTKPWSKLGQPPLLFVTVGRRSFYGFMDNFDPTFQEFMADGQQDNSVAQGLPYAVMFNLSFIVEPLGAQALTERTVNLPKSVGLKGGTGGFTDPARISGAIAAPALPGVTVGSGVGSGSIPLLGNFGAQIGAAIGKLPAAVGSLTSGISGFTLGRK